MVLGVWGLVWGLISLSGSLGYQGVRESCRRACLGLVRFLVLMHAGLGSSN